MPICDVGLIPLPKSGPKAVLCAVSATLLLNPRPFLKPKLLPVLSQILSATVLSMSAAVCASLSTKILDFTAVLGSACTTILEFTLQHF